MSLLFLYSYCLRSLSSLLRLRCESIDKRKKIITQKNCNRWIHYASEEVKVNCIAKKNALKSIVNKTHHRSERQRSSGRRLVKTSASQRNQSNTKRKCHDPHAATTSPSSCCTKTTQYISKLRYFNKRPLLALNLRNLFIYLSAYLCAVMIYIAIVLT